MVKEVLEAVKALKLEVNQLKQQLPKAGTVGVGSSSSNSTTSSSGPNRIDRRLRNRCQQCVKDNVQRCIHCRRCGKDGHYKAYCPSKDGAMKSEN